MISCVCKQKHTENKTCLVDVWIHSQGIGSETLLSCKRNTIFRPCNKLNKFAIQFTTKPNRMKIRMPNPIKFLISDRNTLIQFTHLH